MKVAILTDTHIGVRNDNAALLDFFKKFLDNTFFPTLKKYNVQTVLHGGDVFDRRKYVNIQTAQRARVDFLDKLRPYNVHIIAGNHDVYLKSSNKINILDELVADRYDNIKTYIDPTEVIIHGKKILFLPWINDENREESMFAMRNSTANICIGHLELKGFEMHKGSFSEYGQEADDFAKFDLVYIRAFSS